jgi:hypothetical protein
LDLDLMRAAVVCGLVFFHAASIYDLGDFSVKYAPPSATATVLLAFAKLWGMPLLFVVAGGSAWYSLRSRTAGSFVRERCARLLVPLVVGVVLLVPPQVYLALRARGQDPGSYWRFLAGFFDVRLDLTFPEVVAGADPSRPFELGHLWFLYILLLYSLLLPPVHRYLEGDRGQWLLERVAGLCRRRWGLIALALPVAAIEAALGTWDAGGWNLLAYLPFLLLGFVLPADPRIGRSIRQHLGTVLAVAVFVLPVLFAISYFDVGGAGRQLGNDYNPWSIVWRLLKAGGGWAWTIAVFGLVTVLVQPAAKRRTAPDASTEARGPGRLHRVARYANEAVLPFYVLHQPVIVAIGFYVVHWRLGVLAQYLVISVASLAVTLLVYDLGVRRTAVTRLLLGMRPLRRPAPVRPATAAR